MGQERKITGGVLSLLVLLVLLVCYSRVDLSTTTSDGYLRTSDDPQVSQEASGRPDGDPGWQRATEEKEGLAAALGRSLDSFPSASNATIMFLHVFKVNG